MKKEYNLKLILSLFAIFTTALFSAQTTHTIVLTCDTTKITKDTVKINEECYFVTESEVSEDYTTEVNKGDIVVWRGVPKDLNLNSSVELHQVNHRGGVTVFGKNTLNDIGGIILGEIVEGTDGDEEKYDLKFKVYVDGRKVNGTFTIDPRIKIRR